jgi:hypothetical protein
MTDMVWSFVPWVSFLLGVRFGNVYWGAGLGTAVAIVVLVRAISRHRAHLFDYVGAVYFAGMLALLAILQPDNISTWGRYAQAVAHGSLCLIVFASVLINRPFTEGYAREQAPKEIWHTPQFRAFNRKISTLFGLAFLVGTISLVIAGAIDTRQILLRVIVPIGALALAFTYTQKQAATARRQPAER